MSDFSLEIHCLVSHYYNDNYTTIMLYFPGIDTRIRFSIAPMPGDDAFQQWRDAMKSVARLSNGVPLEFRKNVST